MTIQCQNPDCKAVVKVPVPYSDPKGPEYYSQDQTAVVTCPACGKRFTVVIPGGTK